MTSSIEALWRDGKYALRRLVKDWQFSAGAVVILALGIGANTAVFSILNNTLFQPHPFTASNRLVNLYQNDAKTGEPEGVSYPAFRDLQQEMTMKQRQDLELAPFRLAAASLGALGSLALLLAGVGLYAVVAYAVAQRTGELGIRIALGARGRDLTWLVVGDVTALVAAGIAIGSALSWIGVTLLESSVARILGVNPWALVPVALMILACGAAAAYVPARRAALTDPMAAIRHQ